MMIALSRLLTRVVGIMLMALIASAGIVAAVLCISSGRGSLSLARLAGDIHLPQLRGDVNSFLSRTTTGGPVAVVAALSGLGAILLGLVLIAGCWWSSRPRRIVLAGDEAGSLGSLRRPLARLLADHAELAPEIASARARAHSHRRRHGGWVRITARAAVPADRQQARRAADDALDPVAGDLPLRITVHGRRPTRHDRPELPR